MLLVPTDADLEDSTDSGDGLRSALEASGLCLDGEGEAQGLSRRFMWRNDREVCCRKDDVSLMLSLSSRL